MSKKNGIFGNLFDYSGDGELSIFEQAAEYKYFRELFGYDKKTSYDYEDFTDSGYIDEDYSDWEYSVHSGRQQENTEYSGSLPADGEDESFDETDIDEQIEDALMCGDREELERLVEIKYDGLSLIEALEEDILFANDYKLWFDDDIDTSDTDIIDIDEKTENAMFSENITAAKELIMEKYDADSVEEAFSIDDEYAEEYYSLFPEEMVNRERYYKDFLEDAADSGDKEEFDSIIEELYFGKTVDELLEENEEFASWYEDTFNPDYIDEDEPTFRILPEYEEDLPKQDYEEERKQEFINKRKLIKDKNYILEQIYNEYIDDYYVNSAYYLCHVINHKQLEVAVAVMENLYAEKRIDEKGLINITDYFMDAVLAQKDRDYLWRLRFYVIPVIKQSGITVLEKRADEWYDAVTQRMDDLDYAKKARQQRLEKEENEKYEWRKKYRVKFGINPDDFEKEYQYNLAYNKAVYEWKKSLEGKQNIKKGKYQEHNVSADNNTYIYCEVYIETLDVVLFYISEDENIKSDDMVEVDVKGKRYTGCVKNVKRYSSNETPFPVKCTKTILCRVDTE